jgi:hypothetical protein
MSASKQLRFARYWLPILFAIGIFTGTKLFAIGVTDYNWMQVPTGVVTGVGSPTTSAFNTSGYSGWNTPAQFRWSDLWIPASNLNDNVGIGYNVPGKGDYWATTTFDRAREVDKVSFKFWDNEGTGVERVRIEGSTDGGASYSQIGLYDWGSLQQNKNPTVQNYAVTPGNYTNVRLRLNGEDTNGVGNADYYKGQSDSRSGPGVWLFEAYGDGTLDGDQVNWANKPNFNTVASNSSPGLEYNGLNYNDGSLCNGCGAGRAGEASPWDAGRFTQVDLAQDRLIGKTILDWNDGWWGANITLEHSPDGTSGSFVPVTGTTTTVLAGNASARQITFDPVIDRYFRITNIDSDVPNAYYIFDEWMLYGPNDGTLAATPTFNSTIEGDGSITLTNTGAPDTAIGIFGYTITGPDSDMFDLSNFAQEILSTGSNSSFAYLVDFLGTPNQQDYNAVVTFNTSLGDYSFNLFVSAIPIPEPATFWLLVTAGLGLMGRKRRNGLGHARVRELLG